MSGSRVDLATTATASGVSLSSPDSSLLVGGTPTAPTVEAGASLARGIAASGDTTGVADTAALSTALAAGGVVRGVPGSTYWINGALYSQSNTTLDMRGCTVNQVTGTLLNMLRNRAVDPDATATDGSVTANQATLTSPTLAATAAVGDTVQAIGGGIGGSSWYGTVLSKAGNVLTLSCISGVTASSMTCNLYRAASRNTDVTITGGHWNPVDLTAGTTVLTNFVTCFRRVDRLTIKDLVFTQPGTNGLGGRYNISTGDTNELVVNNIHFTTTAGDGVHVFGPANNVSITDIFGKTGDDFCAASTDWSAENVSDTQGNIANIVFERIYPNGAASAVALASAGGGEFSTSGLTIRTVHGSTVTYGVHALNTGYISNALIEDVKLNVGTAANPCVAMGDNVHTQNRFSGLTIRDVTWLSPLAPTGGIVSVNSTSAAPGPTAEPMITIEGIRMPTSPASGTAVGVMIGNLGAVGPVAIRDIKIEGSPATFVAVQFSGSTNSSCSISDVYLHGATWTLLKASAATTFTNGIDLQDIFAEIATGVSLPAGNPATVIRASNVQFTGTNFITSGGPVTLKAVNLDANTSGGVVNLVGAGATPVTITLANYTQAGAGADTVKDGAQVITLNKANYTTTAP